MPISRWRFLILYMLICRILGSTWEVIRIGEEAAHIWTIVYLGIFGTVVTFMNYHYLLTVTAAIQMSYVTIITPVIAVFLGWLLLDEKLSLFALAGAVVVLIGIRMTLWERQSVSILEAAELP